MKNDWTVVEALRYSRHDWMNHIQLIKGFLALGKTERAEQFIEEMIVQAKQESDLSNLGLIQFAELFLTFNWETHAFKLEYEILCEGSIQADDSWLAEWFRNLFQMVDSWVEPFADNLLYVLLEETAEGLRFFFELSGIIKERERAIQWIEDSSSHKELKQCRIVEHSENELLFEVIL